MTACLRCSPVRGELEVSWLLPVRTDACRTSCQLADVAGMRTSLYQKPFALQVSGNPKNVNIKFISRLGCNRMDVSPS